jgi:hypothetical protein
MSPWDFYFLLIFCLLKRAAANASWVLVCFVACSSLQPASITPVVAHDSQPFSFQVARYFDLPASQSKKRLKETLLSITSLSHEQIKLAILSGFHLHLIGRQEYREPRAHPSEDADEEEDLEPYSE